MLLTRAVEAKHLAQAAPQRFTQCRWIGHTTVQLRGGHSTSELSPPQRNLRHQCLGVSWCYDVKLGRYWGTNEKRKRIKLALTTNHDFMQSLFVKLWEEGQYKPWPTVALTFGSLPSNVISFLCSKDFWLGWRKWLCLAGKA